MVSPKAAQYGLVILGSVVALHLGSTFIKPLVTTCSTPLSGNINSRLVQTEEEFVNKLKKQL